MEDYTMYIKIKPGRRRQCSQPNKTLQTEKEQDATKGTMKDKKDSCR